MSLFVGLKVVEMGTEIFPYFGIEYTKMNASLNNFGFAPYLSQNRA